MTSLLKELVVVLFLLGQPPVEYVGNIFGKCRLNSGFLQKSILPKLSSRTALFESLRYRNADAMKNAMVEESLGGAYGVRGGKIKLRICFECQRQRELFS